MPAYNGEVVTYSVRIFNCVCFMRLYLFVRLLKNSSSLHAEDLYDPAPSRNVFL
jgi:hypothetical protein